MRDSCRFEAEITRKDVSAFSELSGDFNPLHNDAAYAATTEFGRPISHGALLVGLVSRVLGMHIPGTRSLILGMKIQYPKPLFYPAKVSVKGTLKQFHAERNLGVVAVTITDLNKAWTVLEAEVSFSLHEVLNGEVPGETVPAPAMKAVPAGPTRLLLLGGTGGIGSALVSSLKARGKILCLTRQARAAQDGVDYAQVDVEDEAALEVFLRENPASGFFATVHLSAPPVPRAFLSDDLESARRHWRQSVEVPIRLAKWAREADSKVKRLVLVGSTYGTRFPKPHIGAYSLGKAAMEHACRLLVGDLAAQGATINVVAPTVVPVGLNEGMPERSRKSLQARMPTGRLLEPRDVAGVVEFLLSPAAAQINGTTITVDGGLAD